MGMSGAPLKDKINNAIDFKMGRATRKWDISCVVGALNLGRKCAVLDSPHARRVHCKAV